LLAFKLTPANTDDRKPVPDMTQDLLGKLFGDRGYVSQALFEQLYERGLPTHHQVEEEHEKPLWSSSLTRFCYASEH
jgi:hypothetical protein